VGHDGMNKVNQKYRDESDEGYYFKISVLDLTITVDVDKHYFCQKSVGCHLSYFVVLYPKHLSFQISALISFPLQNIEYRELSQCDHNVGAITLQIQE